MEDHLKTTDGVKSLGLHILHNINSYHKSLYTFHVRRNKVITAEKTGESKKVSNRPDRVFRVPN